MSAQLPSDGLREFAIILLLAAISVLAPLLVVYAVAVWGDLRLGRWAWRGWTA